MVAPSYPILAALVAPPVAIDPRRGNHPTEGVAALDPQLDTPLELAARRTAAPIGGGHASPVAQGIQSPLAATRNSTQRPLQPAVPKTENRGSQWAWGVSQVHAPSFSSAATDSHRNDAAPERPVAADTASAEAVAEASAQDILNDSLEALKLNDVLETLELGPTVFDPGAKPAPPMLPINHKVFQTTRLMSPYEQSLAVHQKQFQNNSYPHEGRTIPNQSPVTPSQDGAHRSRSILLRNIPPGIDDDSLRRLLELYGPLRELGAQHRARGGRGSVIATYFDLRHARDAVNALDNSVQFGRRVEARFQCPASSPPPPPSPRQVRNGVISPPGGFRNGNGSTPRHLNGKHNGGNSSPVHRPMNGDDAKPSVSPCFAKGRELRGTNSPGHSPSKQATQQPVNQGTLVVFNLDPSTTAEEIRDLFGSIGDVKEIRGTPNKKHHKFVEFFDVRDAQRALVALNKTELGGKKIKIEISRPGGRVNAVRNSTPSSNGGHPSDQKQAANNLAMQQSYSSGHTPPSLALTGPSIAGHTNHSQFANQSHSPLDGRSFRQGRQGLPLSPFSTPFSAPFAGNDGRRVAGQHVNPSAGNTYPTQGHPVFPGATVGAPAPPSPGFFRNLNQRQSSSYSSLDVHVGNGGRNSSPDQDSFHFEHMGIDVDSQGGRSFDLAADREMDMYRCQVGGTPPASSVFESHRNGTRSAWPAFSAPSRSTGGVRAAPDVPGSAAFRGGPHSHGGPHSLGSIAPYLGRGGNGEIGFDFPSHGRDDGFDLESPRFSPLSSSRSRDNAAYSLLGFQEPSARAPGSSHDMFTISSFNDSTSNGKEGGYYGSGNLAGTVSPFPGSTAQPSPRSLDRSFSLIGGDSVIDGKDVSKRNNLFGGNGLNNGGTIGMHMNGHDAGPRRSSPSGNRSMNGHGNGSSFGGHSNAKFALNIARVMAGEDTRTALMIRNIPNKYNQRMLLSTLEDKHRGQFDFIYLPIDFKNKCNVGYAFINFTRTEYIPDFYDTFHGRKWGRFNSEKNSSLMNEDPKCRPVVFDAQGKQEEFPVGPNVRTKRGPSVREAANRLDHSPPFSPMKPRGRCN